MGLISRLFDFTAGQLIKSSEVDAELDQLISTINALDNANISTSAAIALSKLAVRPMARVSRNAAQSIPNDTLTAVAFDAERFDTNTIHDNSTNNSRLTCKTAGVYSIFANVEWASSSAGGQHGMWFRVNGSQEIAFTRDQVLSSGGPWTNGTSQHLHTEWSLAANDYVECVVRQATGGALNIVKNIAYTPEFGMSLISRAS